MPLQLADPRLRDIERFLKGTDDRGQDRTSAHQQRRFCDALRECDRALTRMQHEGDVAQADAQASTSALALVQEQLQALREQLMDLQAKADALVEERDMAIRENEELTSRISALLVQRAQESAPAPVPAPAPAPVQPKPSPKGGK